MTAQRGSDAGDESDGRHGPLVLIVEGDPERRHFLVDARAVPVLAVTGYEDRHYRVRAMEAGADRVFIKPCEPDSLVREVRELVAQRART